MSGFIYLTHLREFINSNQEIYKLGKSGKLDRSRLYGYPKGSNTILTLFVKNHHKAEEELLQLFSDKFTKMNNIGREYFEGNLSDMLDTIFNYKKNNDFNINDDSDVNNDTSDIFANTLDDFQKLNIYETDEVNELVYKSITGDNIAMAAIVYYYCKDLYNYGEDDCWYKFIEYKWKCIGSQNQLLSNEIETILINVYDKLITFAKNNNVNTNKINELLQITKDFKSTKYIKSIIGSLKEKFLAINNKSRDFVKRLDTNNNLIGFNNGVYDLVAHTFRQGKQEDMITMSVGYDYVKHYTKNHYDLCKFLYKVQPDEKEREYLLTYLSLALFGNALELFTVLTGSDFNGKTKLIELLRIVYGDYCGFIKSQLFIRSRPECTDSNPSILNLQKKRLVIACNSKNKEKLNGDFINFMTNKNITYLKDCDKNVPVPFSPRFITLFSCDNIPEIDYVDQKLSNKLRCINFSTDLCDKSIQNNQNQQLSDIVFDEWKSDFMLLLIRYYNNYTYTKKLEASEKILKWMKMETDIYLNFLNERTEKSDTHIKTVDLYEHFGKWYKKTNPNQNVPHLKCFSSNIKKHKDVVSVKLNGKATSGIKYLQIKSQN